MPHRLMDVTMLRRAASMVKRIGVRERIEVDGTAGAELSEEQLDEVVLQLNGISRSASLEFALRVGATIIHHVYGGDTQAWRVRGPKTLSFRRLAERPDLALSAAALY